MVESSSRNPRLKEIGINLKSSITLVFEVITVFSKAAVKNRNLGFNFASAVATFAEQAKKVTVGMETKNPSGLFDFTVTLYQLKEVSRSLFLGSVINDTLTGSHDAETFVKLSQKVAKFLNIPTAGTDAFFGEAQSLFDS
jgi:hypothetical protein